MFLLFDTLLVVHVSKSNYDLGIICLTFLTESCLLMVRQDVSVVKGCVPCCPLEVGQLLLKCPLFWQLKHLSDCLSSVVPSVPGTIISSSPVCAKLTHGVPLYWFPPRLIKYPLLPPSCGWPFLFEVGPLVSYPCRSSKSFATVVRYLSVP